MVIFVDASEVEDEYDDHVPHNYKRYRDSEGIDVHTGLYVEDINDVSTSEWHRTGQKGAFVNLYGSEGTIDLQVHEIEAGGETEQQCHFFDEIVYVSKGRGMTTLGDGDDQRSFEWKKHSLFCLPAGVPYTHRNLAGDEPSRLVAATSLPQLMNLVDDVDFIFDPPREISTQDRDALRYEGGGTIYRGEEIPERWPDTIPVVWDANFVPDIDNFENLEVWEDRGAGNSSVRFPFPNASLWAHMSEFPVGTYKKAHRHGPGANVGVLSGEGYTLMWQEGDDELIRIDWQPGSIATPPAGWFHQHFNTGSQPARYFAFHQARIGALNNSPLFSTENPNNQIEYVDEDPAIRELYDTELEQTGLESKMPEECYRNPDYDF